MAEILDGKLVSQKIRDEISVEISGFKEKYSINPTLAVIMVGDNPASSVYVRNKHKACISVGIRSLDVSLPSSISEKELLAKIDELNNSPEIHGILVQLPLPSHISEKSVINAISPKKDVDAFHPINVGRLMTGTADLLPCTPAGIIEILGAYGISPEGKNCVVIGRSNIVGKPMLHLLLNMNGTVTVCHSKTQELSSITKRADIIVAAVGKPAFLTADMVKEGAVVIDVGINRTAERGLVGDVDFEGVSKVASYLTPVPGGVGPMTITMLMKNTLLAAKMQVEEKN